MDNQQPASVPHFIPVAPKYIVWVSQNVTRCRVSYQSFDCLYLSLALSRRCSLLIVLSLVTLCSQTLLLVLSSRESITAWAPTRRIPLDRFTNGSLQSRFTFWAQQKSVINKGSASCTCFRCIPTRRAHQGAFSFSLVIVCTFIREEQNREQYPLMRSKEAFSPLRRDNECLADKDMLCLSLFWTWRWSKKTSSRLSVCLEAWACCAVAKKRQVLHERYSIDEMNEWERCMGTKESGIHEIEMCESVVNNTMD